MVLFKSDQIVDGPVLWVYCDLSELYVICIDIEVTFLGTVLGF